MSHCLKAIKNGVKAVVRGRDIGANLRKLCMKYDSDGTVASMLNSLANYRAVEAEKLHRLNRMMAIEVLDDRIDTISAMADGCEVVMEVLQRFDAIFTDHLCGRDHLLHGPPLEGSGGGQHPHHRARSHPAPDGQPAVAAAAGDEPQVCRDHPCEEVADLGGGQVNEDHLPFKTSAGAVSSIRVNILKRLPSARKLVALKRLRSHRGHRRADWLR